MKVEWKGLRKYDIVTTKTEACVNGSAQVYQSWFSNLLSEDAPGAVPFLRTVPCTFVVTIAKNN